VFQYCKQMLKSVQAGFCVVVPLSDEISIRSYFRRIVKGATTARKCGIFSWEQCVLHRLSDDSNEYRYWSESFQGFKYV